MELPMMSIKDVKKHIKRMAELEIAEKSRKDGFTYRFLKKMDLHVPINGKSGMTYMDLRKGFLINRIREYKKQKNERNKLLLIAYAFNPSNLD